MAKNKKTDEIRTDEFGEIDVTAETEAYRKEMDKVMYKEMMSRMGFYTEDEYRDAVGEWLQHVSLSEFITEIEKRVIGQEN